MLIIKEDKIEKINQLYLNMIGFTQLKALKENVKH